MNTIDLNLFSFIFTDNHTLLSSLRTDTNSVSVSTQVDSSLLALGAESTLAALRNSVNWPGLESIMEAFYRHQHGKLFFPIF